MRRPTSSTAVTPATCPRVAVKQEGEGFALGPSATYASESLQASEKIEATMRSKGHSRLNLLALE